MRSNLSQVKLPLFLLAISLLAYGVLLPQLGFYWDDWPWIWLQHLEGQTGMLQIDRAFRPLSGVILFFISLFAGEKPFLWQVTNLLLRWLSGLTCFWLLKALFPSQLFTAIGGALLFLLYPAYQHQFVAVNSSRHLLPFSLFFLSLYWMIRAVRSETRAWFWHVLALGLQLAQMLSTEYYYGLECLRPVFIYYALRKRLSRREAIAQSLQRGVPYLLVLLSVIGWRYAITQLPNYSNYALVWQENNEASSTANMAMILSLFGEQLKAGAILAWTRLVEFPDVATFGVRKTALYGSLLGLGGAGVYAYLIKYLPKQWPAPPRSSLLLGGVTLACAGLPFLVANLRVDLSFPANRLTLPLAFGASLLLISLIDFLIPKETLRVLALSGVCALAIGAHFQNAVDFQRDWAYQRAFFEQLHWRIPHIQPNTLILSNVIEQTHSSDNSLTAALNWLYFDRLSGNDLPLLMFYVETRAATHFPAMQPGIAVERRYGRFLFHGNTSRALVLSFEPPACLRVIHPRYDQANPWLSREIRQAVGLSDLERIDVELRSYPASFPIALSDQQQVWCYAYQKADLARQQGRWDEVVSRLEEGLGWGDSPNRADEYVPLLQAYAFQTNWQAALRTTSQIARTAKRYSPYLCQIWGELHSRIRPPQDVFGAVQRMLQCSP